MDLSFFTIFISISVFLLILGWLSKNQVAMFFAGLLFIFTGLALMTGVQYDCGFIHTESGFINYTYVANSSNINHTFQNLTTSNNVRYCTWDFDTDAANGLTLNTGGSVLLMFLGVYLIYSTYLSRRQPEDL